MKEKHARRQLFDRNAAVFAGVVLRKQQILLFFPKHIDNDEAAGERCSGFDAVRQTLVDFALDHQAVHNDFNIVFLFFSSLISSPKSYRLPSTRTRT